MMKIRRNHFFQFMTILYFIIVFCMCITRFNIIMTLIGGPLTRIDAVNMIPFHSIRENLKYGHSPVSWDMLYNVVMFVPFGIIYCYYQKTFSIYKAIGLSFLTTFSIEAAQFILKTGVVDIDDLIVNTIGSLLGIFLYIALQKILQWKQLWNVHEVIDTIATILPPLFISIVVEMIFWRCFTNAVSSSHYSPNRLRCLRLYFVNKGFFIEVQTALRGILYWNFLVDSFHTIENIDT